MRKLYFAFGLIGIVCNIITIIIVASAKSIDTSLKVGVIITSIISFVGCAVYITVSQLMDKTDKHETDIAMIKNYLSTTEDYQKYQKKLEDAVLEDLTKKYSDDVENK